jgi:RHS repeat-associated protein
VSTYTYDGLGRLTNEAESGSGVTDAMTYAYTYDSRSNRATLTATGAQSYTTAYSYDKNDRLLQTAKTTGQNQEIVNYQYDANGNTLSALTETLTSTTSGTASMSLGTDGGYELYTYNGFNQLISTIQDGVETTYVYKPDGLRYNKVTNGTTTTHIWDGANIVAELTGSTVSATYVRGINLIAKGGGTQYYSFNAHGDVVQLTNSSGTVTKNYRYDAFGVEVDPQGTDTNPWQYCGEYWDRETGTVYLRARYYDPVVGRFTSEDTHWNPRNMIYGDEAKKVNERRDVMGLSVYNQGLNSNALRQSSNLYVYGMNNPVKWIDPTGKAVTSWDRANLPSDFIKRLEYYTENWDNVGDELKKRWRNDAERMRSKYRNEFEYTDVRGITKSTITGTEIKYYFDDNIFETRANSPLTIMVGYSINNKNEVVLSKHRQRAYFVNVSATTYWAVTRQSFVSDGANVSYEIEYKSTITYILPIWPGEVKYDTDGGYTWGLIGRVNFK